MSRLLTLKEMAKELKVPESSLRKYREIFSQFIPSVGTGRSRRYRPEAKDVLRDIREMREEMHVPWDAITDMLAEKYPIDATPENPSVQPQPEPRQFVASPPMGIPVHQEEPTRNVPTSMDVTPQPQSVAPMAAQYLKKMTAMSEKQMMIVNAMALELMHSVEDIRKEARKESERLQADMNSAIEGLASDVKTLSHQERMLLRDIKGRLDSMDNALGKLDSPDAGAPATATAPDVTKMRESLTVIKQKLQQREKTLQEYKRSFNVVKKENTELRDFKARHMTRAEERVREVKAARHSSVFRRFLGLKP